jgi:hypothetical protein
VGKPHTGIGFSNSPSAINFKPHTSDAFTASSKKILRTPLLRKEVEYPHTIEQDSVRIFLFQRFVTLDN